MKNSCRALNLLNDEKIDDQAKNVEHEYGKYFWKFE